VEKKHQEDNKNFFHHDYNLPSFLNCSMEIIAIVYVPLEPGGKPGQFA
jgi:hypothetical protein